MTGTNLFPAVFAQGPNPEGDSPLPQLVGPDFLLDQLSDLLPHSALGEPGSDTDNYIDWLTVTTQTIVDALS